MNNEAGNYFGNVWKNSKTFFIGEEFHGAR
jgi:hypothetical protein